MNKKMPLGGALRSIPLLRHLVPAWGMALFAVTVLAFGHIGYAQEPTRDGIEWLGEFPVVADTFAAEGTRLYLGAGAYLTVLETADPSSPQVISQTGPFHWPIRGVAVDGPIIYVATGAQARTGTLHLLDTSTLEEQAVLELRGEARGVALDAGRAYVSYAAQDRAAFGVQVIDVADPTQPYEVATWEPSTCRNDVAITAGRVFCTWAARSGPGGLEIIDATDLLQPQPAGSYRAPGYAFGLAVQDNHAYVAWTTDGPESATAPGGLRIVDVSDPTRPAEIAAIHAGPSTEVRVQDGFALLGTLYSGLRVFDVRNPSAPVEVAHLQSSGGRDRITQIQTSGDRVYALRLSAGEREEPRLWLLRNIRNDSPAPAVDVPAGADEEICRDSVT